MDVGQRFQPLARWVASYKRNHEQAPTEADVPPDLASMWMEFQNSKSALAACCPQPQHALQEAPTQSVAVRSLAAVREDVTTFGTPGREVARMGEVAGTVPSGYVSDEEHDEVPPTPLSQLVRRPVHGLLSPPRPGGGAGGSMVKETPPESIRRRSRLVGIGIGGWAGGDGNAPFSPVPCRLTSGRDGGGLLDGGGSLFKGGGRGLFEGYLSPQHRSVVASPGRALTRQLLQRRLVSGAVGASSAAAAMARNPFSRIDNMKAAAQREGTAASAASADVAAMLAEAADWPHHCQQNATSAAPAGAGKVVTGGGMRPSASATAATITTTMSAAAAAAAISSTPLRLLRRAQEERQQHEAIAGNGGSGAPLGSPFSPLPMPRRRQLRTAALGGGADADTVGGTCFASRAVVAALEVPLRLTFDGAAEDEADDVARRRAEEGYDTLAAEDDAALAQGVGGRSATDGDATTAAVTARCGRRGLQYGGDAQSEMRRLLVSQVSVAVDMDRLALLGPRGAEAAGIRSPGAAGPAGAVPGAACASDRLRRQQLTYSVQSSAAANGTAGASGDDIGGLNAHDDEQCDVAEELLPIEIREEVQRRRRELRLQQHRVVEKLPPRIAADEPSPAAASMLVDGGNPLVEKVRVVEAALDPVNRRAALRRQLLGRTTTVGCGVGGLVPTAARIGCHIPSSVRDGMMGMSDAAFEGAEGAAAAKAEAYDAASPGIVTAAVAGEMAAGHGGAVSRAALTGRRGCGRRNSAAAAIVVSSKVRGSAAAVSQLCGGGCGGPGNGAAAAAAARQPVSHTAPRIDIEDVGPPTIRDVGAVDGGDGSVVHPLSVARPRRAAAIAAKLTATRLPGSRQGLGEVDCESEYGTDETATDGGGDSSVDAYDSTEAEATPKRCRTAPSVTAAAAMERGLKLDGRVTSVQPAKRVRHKAAPTSAAATAAGGGFGGGGGTAYGGTIAASAATTAAAATGLSASGAASSAGGGGGSAPSRQRPSRTIRESRGNFVKMCNTGSRPKHSFRFEGRSSAGDRALKASQSRRRRIINGKVVITGGRVPHAAGQGADFLEGFGQGSRCFKCGATGHWARDCPGTQGLGSPSQRAGNQQQKTQQEQQHGPVLEGQQPRQEQEQQEGGGAAVAVEAEAAGKGTGGGREGLGFGGGGNFVLQARSGRPGVLELHPQEPLQLHQLVPGLPSPEQIAEDPRIVSDEQLSAVLQAVWGHPGFRGQQLELVRGVLEGSSRLVVLPTGAGKSLIYQLPSILLPGITLVVSPLLALMDDQLTHLPPPLRGRGACLSGGQTREQLDASLSAAARGSVKLLYVAPEKLLTPWLLAALRRLPISLIAVDEAHCVSEWGHSFRPAYLRLGNVLRCVLRPRCVLGFTATATVPTAKEVAAVLGLDPRAITREPPLRQNLRLKVLHMQPGASESGASRTALLQLLRSQELSAVHSVLVYVAMQWQADEVAGWLQSTHGISASSYHAGRPLPERNAVALSFRTGRTRVVVATVAFGMGVDHPSIGAVVHLQMPRSLEDYVQQAGRAGRDGREASCYLFLDDQDYKRYRSLVFSSSTELSSVKAFLHRIFTPTPLLNNADLTPEQDDNTTEAGSRGSSYGVLQLSTTASELDLSDEVMETIMSYLQQDDGAPGGGGGYVSVLPSCAARVDVYFHRAPAAALAARWPVVAAMLRCRPPLRVYRGCHKVDMAALVAAGEGGISSSQALRQFSQLAALNQIHFEPVFKLKAISWQLLRRPTPPPHPPGRAPRSVSSATSAAISALATRIHSRLEAQTVAAAARLDMVWGLMAGAFLEGASCEDQEVFLRPRVTAYFDSPGAFLLQQPLPQGAEAPEPSVAAAPPPLPRSPPGCPPLPLAPRSSTLVVEVEAFLTGAKAKSSVPLTPVAVARILHGLAGPAFPADAWRKAHEWGRFKAVDFGYVRAVAAMVLSRRVVAEPGAASGRPPLVEKAGNALAAAGGGGRKRRLEQMDGE